MSVSEVATFGINKQLLQEVTAPAEDNISSNADMPLMKSGGDVVTLSFSEEQEFLQLQSEAQVGSIETIQEISSVAQAASTFSQAIDGNLNSDELAAIQKLAAKIEPIAQEFLSGDPEKFNLEQAADMALPDVASIETESSDIDFENIRQFPSLVSATVDAGFEKQFQALNATSRELIVSSLSELMKFFREKVVQVLEPLRHSSSLTERGTQVPTEVGLMEQS